MGWKLIKNSKELIICVELSVIKNGARSASRGYGLSELVLSGECCILSLQENSIMMRNTSQNDMRYEGKRKCLAQWPSGKAPLS